MIKRCIAGVLLLPVFVPPTLYSSVNLDFCTSGCAPLIDLSPSTSTFDRQTDQRPASEPSPKGKVRKCRADCEEYEAMLKRFQRTEDNGVTP